VFSQVQVCQLIGVTWFPVLKDFTHPDQYNFGVNQGSSSFHELHPQFAGYTRGKLHELVMKYFKSRELTLAINEVLDPWISAKQPKKEFEAYFSHNSASRNFLPGTMVMSYTTFYLLTFSS
jgi:[histone H3]-lysine4 N-trimethyltransferase ATXR3